MPTISQLQRAAMNAAKRAQQAAKDAMREAERLANAARRTATSPTARHKLQRDLQNAVRKLGAAGRAAYAAAARDAWRPARQGAAEGTTKAGATECSRRGARPPRLTP
jgi:hypothetical protein